VQLRPPARQALLESLGDWLATLENPVILAGDLNSTDRGVGYRTLLGRADLIDAMRVTWASTTSTKWWPLLLRIDHVLVRGICPSSARNTALEGSDHRSVVAELAFC
jgi:endonuclease/exonuclease/phosphatase (EEP) superfamily protein YafD